MAQQYQTRLPPGQQHAQPPYIPQYGQQPNYQPNYTHHNAAPSIPTNARRFDLNSGHAPTPPPPLLPFPGWDSAFFKQLTGNQTVPLPPPPPPPPMLHQTTAPPPFQHFPYHQMPLPGISPFASSQIDGKPYSPQGLSPAIQSPFIRSQEDRVLEHPQPTHLVGTIARQNPFAQVVTRNVVDALEATLDETSNVPSDHNTNASTRNEVVSAAREREIEYKPDTPVLDLRGHAKEALRALRNGGINYDDLVKEGIAADVLQIFYKELGFDLPATVVPPQLKLLTPVGAETLNAKSTTAVESPIPAVNTPKLGPADVGLERKDRIAKLLALRKNQGPASSRSSQVGSPVPQEPPNAIKPHQSESKEGPAVPAAGNPTTSDPSTLRPAVASEKMTLGHSGDQGIESAGRAQTLSAKPVSPVIKLSQLGDLSIPGLFMTSADDLDPDNEEQDDGAIIEEVCAGQDQLAIHRKTPSRTSSRPPSSRKRSVDDSGSVAPPSKRRASGSPPPTGPPVLDSDPVVMQDRGSAPTDELISIRPKINQLKLNERLAALKANLLQKNSQKKALHESVPVLASEISSTRAQLTDQQERLAEVKLRVASLHADLRQAVDEEAQINKEVQRLQEQLALSEGNQRRLSRELARSTDRESQRSQSETRLGTARQRPDTSDMKQPDSVETQPFVNDAIDTEDYSSNEAIAEVDQNSRTQSATAAGIISEDDRTMTDAERQDIEQENIDRQLNAEVAVGNTHIKDDPEMEENEGLSRSMSDASEHSQSGADDNDTEEMQVSEASGTDERMSIDDEDNTARSEGSASMSDSGSEEYEPAPAPQPSEIVGEILDEGEYDPQELELHVSAEANVDAEEEDEPAEVLLQDPAIGHLGPNAAHESETTLPIAEAVQPAPTAHDTGTEPPTEIAVNPVLATDEETADTNMHPNVIRDLATASEVIDSEAPREAIERSSKFTPYQSPLLAFKSYRFHPDFRQTVDNGFRSLTYSNAIDPSRPLCPTELDGAECNDIECHEQHFRSISLSDDKILVQMSSASDLKDKDQRDAYLLGLKKVIAGLREKGVKEFSEVATALSQYKREWTTAQAGMVA